MKQYKIIVAYDGTDFSGWMPQPHESSIVQTLQDTFHRVFKKTIQLLGASKTDAGVHALGQVAIFKTDVVVEAAKMRWAWNNALPSTITIRSLEEDDRFHPHKEVVDKTYFYHMSVVRPLPFWARYVVEVPHIIDWPLFDQVLEVFKGTHNFNAFYTGTDHVDTVRTIVDVKREFLKQYDAYRIIINGDRFMRHMVRRVVGAAVAVATRDSVAIATIQEALQTGKTNTELPTAPAKGLLLYNVRYTE